MANLTSRYLHLQFCNHLIQMRSNFLNSFIFRYLGLVTTLTSLPIFRIREDAVNHTRSRGSEGERRTVTLMPYTPQHIANYFLDRADQENLPMTQLKLLKLVYIAYGWYIALVGERLFDEEIQAWKHGPVIPSLYHEFKHFGSKPISFRAIALDLDTWKESTPEVPRSDKVLNFILDTVWNSYKRFSGWSLRNKTHEAGTPWSQVYREGERDIVIRDDDVKEHFKERIKGYLDAASAAHGRATGSVRRINPQESL